MSAVPISILPHVPTLALSTVFVAAILGGLLLFAWLQDCSHSALLWWGPAYFCVAIGTALLALRGAVPNFLSIEIANAVIIFAAGAMWQGARAFEGKQTSFWLPCGSAAAWIVACQFSFFASDVKLRIVVCSLVLGAFLFAAADELRRGRNEPLLSRWPAIAALSVYATMMLMRIPLVHVFALPPAAEIFKSNWFGFMSLGTLLYLTTLAFLMLALTKERAELLHKRAARVDPLTGLLNRRAFLASGEVCLGRFDGTQRPASVLVFDLDQFKQINDRFGHPIGDQVLQLFGEVGPAELRKTDIIGRIGGEEFAAVLPDCDAPQAWETAERIRQAFSRAARQAGHIDATVSVGVAESSDQQDLNVLLARADRAVYRAKAAGRNCVRLALVEEDAERLPLAEQVSEPARPNLIAA
jgi:diguanylate cyclase (GGDEF)-like protein